MEEKLGRIMVLKDTMLFVTNYLFDKQIKETTSKENILKMVPEIYKEADAEDIIKMLPYDSYLALEKLIKYVKENKITNEDITDKIFELEDKYGYEVNKLEEAMIVVLRVTKDSHRYYINQGTIESVEKIFTAENKKIAERYGKLEKIIYGILNTYGVVEDEFYRTTICTCMEEILTNEFIEDFSWSRLNLNMIIDYRKVGLPDDKILYFTSGVEYDEYEEKNLETNTINDIIKEQLDRDLEYKKFSKDEFIENAEEKLNQIDLRFLKYLKKFNKNIYDFQILELKKGIKRDSNPKILAKILELVDPDTDEEYDKFLLEFMIWYNNIPRYILCGYSPAEMILRINDFN